MKLSSQGHVNFLGSNIGVSYRRTYLAGCSWDLSKGIGKDRVGGCVHKLITLESAHATLVLLGGPDKYSGQLVTYLIQ